MITDEVSAQLPVKCPGQGKLIESVVLAINLDFNWSPVIQVYSRLELNDWLASHNGFIAPLQRIEKLAAAETGHQITII